jgi:hypothetical protein
VGVGGGGVVMIVSAPEDCRCRTSAVARWR